MDINEKMKLQEWSQDMIDQKNSGLSQAEWCRKERLSINTFQYRCKRVRRKIDELSEQIAQNSIVPASCSDDSIEFAKVCVSSEDKDSGGISISVDNTSILIASDAKDEHVRLVLEVFSHAQ